MQNLFGELNLNLTTETKNDVQNTTSKKTISNSENNIDTEKILNSESEMKKFKTVEYGELRKEYPTSFDIKEVYGFDYLIDFFNFKFQQSNTHHAYIIKGDYGIGKSTFVYNLIYNLIVKQNINQKTEDSINSQQELLKNKIHPDVFIMNDDNKTSFLIEDTREMLEFIKLKAVYGAKFVIIDSIDKVNINAANALLKTLEEPTERTFFFLIHHDNSRELLPTISSRCFKINVHDYQYKIDKIIFDQIVLKEIPYISKIDLEKYFFISNKSIGLSVFLAKNNFLENANFLINEYNQKKLNIVQIVNNILNIFDKIDCVEILKSRAVEEMFFYIIQFLNFEKQKDRNDALNIFIEKKMKLAKMN